MRKSTLARTLLLMSAAQLAMSRLQANSDSTQVAPVFPGLALENSPAHFNSPDKVNIQPPMESSSSSPQKQVSKKKAKLAEKKKKREEITREREEIARQMKAFTKKHLTQKYEETVKTVNAVQEKMTAGKPLEAQDIQDLQNGIKSFKSILKNQDPEFEVEILGAARKSLKITEGNLKIATINYSVNQHDTAVTKANLVQAKITEGKLLTAEDLQDVENAFKVCEAILNEHDKGVENNDPQLEASILQRTRESLKALTTLIPQVQKYYKEHHQANVGLLSGLAVTVVSLAVAFTPAVARRAKNVVKNVWQLFKNPRERQPVVQPQVARPVEVPAPQERKEPVILPREQRGKSKRKAHQKHEKGVQRFKKHQATRGRDKSLVEVARVSAPAPVAANNVRAPKADVLASQGMFPSPVIRHVQVADCKKIAASPGPSL